jgi:hypothetical protein
LNQLKGATLSEDFEEMRDVCSTFLYGDTKRRSQFPTIVLSTPFTIVNQTTSFAASVICSISTCCRRKSGPDDQVNSIPNEDTLAVIGAFGIVVASVSIYLIWLWGELYGMVYGSATLILNQHLFHAMLFRRSFPDFIFSIILGDLFAVTAVCQTKKKEKKTVAKDLERGETDDQVESNAKPPIPNQDDNSFMDVVEVSTSSLRSLPVSPKSALATLEEREGFGDPIVTCMSTGVSCTFDEDEDLPVKKKETTDKSRGRFYLDLEKRYQDENSFMDVVEVSTSSPRRLPVSPKAALATVEEREGFGDGDPIVICMSMGVSCTFDEDEDLPVEKKETTDKSRGKSYFDLEKQYSGQSNDVSPRNKDTTNEYGGTTNKYGGRRGKYSLDQSSPKKVIQNKDANLCQEHQKRAIENKAENSLAKSGKRTTVIEYDSPKREATGKITDWDESVSRALTDAEYIPSVYKELKQKLEAEYSVNEKSVSTASMQTESLQTLSVTESNGTPHHQLIMTGSNGTPHHQFTMTESNGTSHRPLVADNFVSIDSSPTALPRSIKKPPTRTDLESVTSAPESMESRFSDQAKHILITPSYAHSARVPTSPQSHQQDYIINSMESTAIRSDNSASTTRPDTRNQQDESNPGILEQLKAIKRKIEADFENAMNIDIGPSMTMADTFRMYSQTFSDDDSSGEETETLSRDTFSDGGVSALTDDPVIARDPNQTTDRCDQFVY